MTHRINLIPAFPHADRIQHCSWNQRISTTQKWVKFAVLTSFPSVLSNSTTRPPRSPVAKCSPDLSNSIAEIMSTAKNRSISWSDLPRICTLFKSQRNVEHQRKDIPQNQSPVNQTQQSQGPTCVSLSERCQQVGLLPHAALSIWMVKSCFNTSELVWVTGIWWDCNQLHFCR